jgi:hypothetical protein
LTGFRLVETRGVDATEISVPVDVLWTSAVPASAHNHIKMAVDGNSNNATGTYLPQTQARRMVIS